MPGIGRDGAQGLGHGSEQDVEDDPSVAESDGGDHLGQGEDDMKVGRLSIGIEMDPKYFEVACNRISKAQSKASPFAEAGGPLPLFGGADD